MQGEILDGGVGLQEVAQSLGYRKHPFSNRQVRDHMVGKVGGSLDHAARIAGWADAVRLAGIGNRKSCPQPAQRALVEPWARMPHSR